MLMNSISSFFYAPASIDWGHIVLPVSVCLSAENLTCELNIFFFPTIFTTFSWTEIEHPAMFNFSFANCLNLAWSKIFKFGQKANLYNTAVAYHLHKLL